MTDTIRTRALRMIAQALEAPTAKGYKARIKYQRALEDAGFLVHIEGTSWYVWGNGVEYGKRFFFWEVEDYSTLLPAVLRQIEQEQESARKNADPATWLDTLSRSLTRTLEDAQRDYGPTFTNNPDAGVAFAGAAERLKRAIQEAAQGA